MEKMVNWIIWIMVLETIAMKQFMTGDLNKQIGDITDAASREPVMLTGTRSRDSC